MFSKIFQFSFIYISIWFCTFFITKSIQVYRPIEDALYLHNKSGTNLTRDDCFWMNDRKKCSTEFTKLFLIRSNKSELVNIDQNDWLRNSFWSPDLESVFLVHGYASSHQSLPMDILIDAYKKNGKFNIFVFDWSLLSTVPCYPAAIHNMQHSSKCLAKYMTFLRNSGVMNSKMTCVGHSLGAHLCGQVSNSLNFRVQKIIGLDPARPLIRDLKNFRLDSSDALAVHVFHTNGGHYGSIQKIGSIDFCLNGGRVQPFCENNQDVNLCSHLGSVCYLAESVAVNTSYLSEPCSRRCGSSNSLRFSSPILMSYQTEVGVTGTFCYNNSEPPHCKSDKRCCMNR